jgi:hypothetical protein
MRCKVQVRFGAERPEDSSTTSGLSLHFRWHTAFCTCFFALLEAAW